jgi:hypothetical protein
MAISAVSGKGLMPMLERLWGMIEEQRELEKLSPPPVRNELPDEPLAEEFRAQDMDEEEGEETE